MEEARTAARSLADIFAAVPAGERLVQDRSASPDGEALLDEWFTRLTAAHAHGGVDPYTVDVLTGEAVAAAAAPVAQADAPEAAPSEAAAAAASAAPAAAASESPDDACWSPALQDLVTAVAAVRAQVPAELPGPQAVAEAQVLLQQLEALRSVVLTRVADVDLRDLHVLADAPSTTTWLATQQTSLTRGELAFARRLATFPAVAAAVDAGSLSIAGASRVAGALVKARRHLDRPDGLIDGQPGGATISAVIVDGVRTAVCQARAGLADDDPLLAVLVQQLDAIATKSASQLDRLTDALLVLATHVEAAQLPGALAMLLDALLSAELEDRAETAHEQRGLRLRLKDDGSGWTITRGDLDLECGELLQTVLDAERAVDPGSPVDTAAWAAQRDGNSSGDSTGAPPPRSLDQQRHDALRNGLRRYLDSGIAGLRDKAVPHVSVTVGLDSLHAAPGSLPAVAASGARLPRSLLRRWLCDSALTRFVMSLGHKVVAVSHTGRTLTATERKIKRLETGGYCEVAGCSRGPGCRLVPHHPTPYAECGTTSLEDTVWICEQNHHDLHVGGKTLRLKDGRRLGPHGWLPPDPGPPDSA